MRMQRLAWMTCALLALGCGSEDTADEAARDEKIADAPELNGKADGSGAPILLGAFPGGSQTVVIEGSALEWRVAIFGETRLRITVKSPDGDLDPLVSVYGPIPADADALVGYNDDEGGDSFDSSLDVSVSGHGAVRVVAATYGIAHLGQETNGRLQIKVECLEGCAQEMIGLDEMLRRLQADLGPEQLDALLAQGISAFFPEPDSAATVDAQIRAALAGERDGPFPLLPLAAAGSAQPILERPDHDVKAPEAVTFRLDELLTRGCTPARSSLSPVHATLPQVTTGSRSDYTLGDCELQRAQDFASVLNNLALDNGSKVVAPDRDYESVEEVVVALLDAGHHIRAENNRYYADFLGLYYDGVAVAAPVWLDTGIELSGGGTFALPAPHTHHTIYVSGPLVNATIMYYMGVSGGVSFRAVESARAPWTGERVLYAYDSAEDPGEIVQLFVTAARLRKVWTERGAGLPALGYGQLGVCNDSTAVLEQDLEGTVTIFPLAQPGVEGAPADVVDQLLAELPSDLDGFDPAEASSRIRATLPHTQLPGLEEAVDQLPGASGSR